MRLFLLIISAALCSAAGVVTQSITALGITGNWTLTFSWTGDASTGSVPITAAQFGANQGTVQGFRILQVETVPGSPAPTNNYAIQITDFFGTDMMAGSMAGVSSTVGQLFSATSATPPINGVFSLKISGQGVAGAKGRTIVYFGPTTMVNATAGSPGPVGPAGPNGPAGPPGQGINTALYNFAAQAPGGTLTGTVSANVTMTPCPLGVNGTDSGHQLYVSAGTGTAEAVLITGGTCTSGATSGTVIFTPANNHSGAWTISSATAGGQEAAQANPGAGISFPAGTVDFYGTLTLSPPATASAVLCPSLGSAITTHSATLDIIRLYSSNPTRVVGCTITSAVTRTGGVGIVLGDGITDNSIGSHIDNNQILLQYQGVHVKSANNWVMTGNLVTASNVDLWIENLVNGDQGDFAITSNGFQQFGSPVSAIKWNSAGGMKFIGNKIVSVVATAMDLSCNSTVCTGDILIANNSIEGFTATGINLAVSALSGSIGLIQIEDNQLGGSAAAYSIVAAGAGANVVEQLVISGNTSESCKFLNLGANVEYVIVSGNQVNTPTVFSTMTSPTAVYLDIRNNMVFGYSPGDANIYGNYANMILNHQDRGYIAVANLPSALLDTSAVMTQSTGTSSCVAGGILTLARRINGAWNCSF